MTTQKSFTAPTLRLYWQAAAKYPWRIIALVLTQIGAGVLSVSMPLYLKRFFDTLTSQQPVAVVAVTLFSIIWVLLWLHLGRWALAGIFRVVVNKVYIDGAMDISQDVFAQIHRHSFDFFNNTFVGSLVKKSQFFIWTFERVVGAIVEEFLPIALNCTLMIVILWWNNIWLGVGVLVWLIVFLAINVVFSRAKMPLDVKRSEASTKLSGLIADSVTNQSAVKLFNGFDREAKSFFNAADNHRHWKWKSRMLQLSFDITQGLLAVALELGILVLAVRLWQQGLMTVGTFVLIQAYLMSIFNNVWGFGNILRNLYEALIEAGEMTEILLLKPDIRDRRGAKPLRVIRGMIEFSRVRFKYRQGRVLLNNFSLRIEPHQRVALVGPSGAGKTTIIKILLRLYDITSGKIKIDRQDISKVTQDSIWQHVSFVPQEPVLFHRSLRENIGYGKPDATEVEIMAAAKAARCHEFIEMLSQGYDTLVGERGIKLSGGERQRVAIARAILRNAPILILDEATSSLDSESERLIQEALRELMKNKTVIVIAHRLSTIRQMDRIVVVDNGQVIEEGSHKKLATKDNGLYSKLWKLQVGGFLQ